MRRRDEGPRRPARVHAPFALWLRHHARAVGVARRRDVTADPTRVVTQALVKCDMRGRVNLDADRHLLAQDRRGDGATAPAGALARWVHRAGHREGGCVAPPRPCSISAVLAQSWRQRSGIDGIGPWPDGASRSAGPAEGSVGKAARWPRDAYPQHRRPKALNPEACAPRDVDVGAIDRPRRGDGTVAVRRCPMTSKRYGASPRSWKAKSVSSNANSRNCRSTTARLLRPRRLRQKRASIAHASLCQHTFHATPSYIRHPPTRVRIAAAPSSRSAAMWSSNLNRFRNAGA